MNQSLFCRCATTHPLSVLCRSPQAVAGIAGSEAYPSITGVVRFYQTDAGVIVYAEIHGLPSGSHPCGERIFGFHLHEGGSCSGNAADPFANAGVHDNPNDCTHPYHTGDLPPLFGNDGFAVSAFLTDRFSVEEVLGKTIIIHDKPDDFTTQPSGNSGTKIACGVIRRTGGICR